VLAEFYWVVTSRLNPPLPHDAARDAVRQLGALPVVSSDASLVFDAIDLSVAADLALWDAMIVSATRRAGCDEILTEDLNHGRVIDGVQVMDPFV
jgi:predicted nucleic acid-binding protein